MYCKNCGKPLSEEDKFCSRCGQKIEEEFVPAFRQKKPSAPAPAQQEKPRKKTFHIENFQWDLDGYPTDNKKTEDVQFDWNSVLEDKQRRLFESRLQEVEAEEAEAAAPVEAEEPESGRSLEEEIFADMGEIAVAEPTDVYKRSDAKIDKFYTYNQKNEQLQAMLDQEYERIRSGQSSTEAIADDEQSKPKSERNRHEEFDWTLPPRMEQERHVTAEPALQVETGESDIKSEPPEYVGVVLSQPPAGFVTEVSPARISIEKETPAVVISETSAAKAPEASADTEETGEAAAKAETAKPVSSEAKAPAKEDETARVEKDADGGRQTDGNCPPSEETKDAANGKKRSAGENNKLTFDDVFGDDDDDVNERPKKKGKVLKVIAIILCILIVIELTMIGIQYFAPDSAAAQFINNGYAKVAQIFGASEKEVAVEPQESEITRLITAQIEKNKNIALVEEDSDLRFDSEKDYGFEDLSTAYAFENKPWYTGSDGNVTYGDEIIGTIIQYYSSWVDKMNGQSREILSYVDATTDFYQEVEEMEAEEGKAYGINRLSIGEMKSDGSGFYVMVEMAAVDSKTKEEEVSKQIVYLEPDNKSMKIAEINNI